MDNFLQIFEHICILDRNSQDTVPNFCIFRKLPRDLQKSTKLNFSQQIKKDMNLRIPKHIDFLKIGQFLVIWWPKAFRQLLKKFMVFFMYFLQNQIETKTYVNL